MEQFRVYVAVGSKIYEVTYLCLDCRYHTMQLLSDIPRLLRYDKVADIMDGKIYVINLHGVKSRIRIRSNLSNHFKTIPKKQKLWLVFVFFSLSEAPVSCDKAEIERSKPI
ncbi:hypothetical protein YC2023_029195 [Brassica napus]